MIVWELFPSLFPPSLTLRLKESLNPGTLSGALSPPAARRLASPNPWVFCYCAKTDTTKKSQKLWVIDTPFSQVKNKARKFKVGKFSSFDSSTPFTTPWFTLSLLLLESLASGLALLQSLSTRKKKAFTLKWWHGLVQAELKNSSSNQLLRRIQAPQEQGCSIFGH